MRRSLPLAVALACFATPLQADSSSSVDEMTQLRQHYLDAEKMLKRGKLREWRKLKQELKDYPLYPYLVLRELKAQGASATYDQVTAVLKGNRLPIPPYFLSWWLSRLHSERNWFGIIDHFTESRSITAKCRHAEALYRVRRLDEALEAVRPLWLVRKSQHKSCDTVFKLGLDSGLISDHLIWDRLLLTSRRGATSMNKYLRGLFRSNDMVQWASRLAKVHRNPGDMLTKYASSWDQSQFGRDLIQYGVSRIRAKDPRRAALAWVKLKELVEMPEDEKAEIERSIAVSLAFRHDMLAIEWFANLPLLAHDQSSSEWWARTALSNQQWGGLMNALNSMDEETAQRPGWRYWRAKELHELGNPEGARAIFEELSTRSDYYGFLSADLLDKDYVNLARTAELSDTSYKSVMSEPGVQRMREFIALGHQFSARRELFALGNDEPDQFWWDLAHLLHQWGWHDGAIRAYRKVDFADAAAIEILYPRPYIATVRNESARHSIPMPWIFGIMRQESLFVRNIRSSAGAIGLLQLLPSTARAEANRQKLKTPTGRDLQQPSLNVKLGTGYLKSLLKRNDGNLIYSLGGYNGGPRNVLKWRKSSPAATAQQWVETIPFRETRRYVKKILANIIIYERVLELKTSRISDYVMIPNQSN